MDLGMTGRPNELFLQHLKEEHRRYSEKLDRLSQNAYLSTEEQMEEIKLKKLKLRIKDEIAGNRAPFPSN